MRGTQSQDRVVAAPDSQTLLLRRYGAHRRRSALALLLLVVWSARAWLSSEKIIARDRLRTAVVERGPFVRDVAATGIVVAAVSPTLFAEAPGTVIYKVRAGDTVKAGDVLGTVDSAALTNEYERERATLVSADADAQSPDHRSAPHDPQEQPGHATSPRCDHGGRARVQARRGRLEHPRDPGARLQARAGRSRDRQAQLRACRRDRGSREGQPAARTAQPARAMRDAQALLVTRLRAARRRADAQVAGRRHRRDAQRRPNARRSRRTPRW